MITDVGLADLLVSKNLTNNKKNVLLFEIEIKLSTTKCTKLHLLTGLRNCKFYVTYRVII